ncbi:MAG: hypothetical protein UR85_C0002G0026 [Candidatus Nomurabacteria bacterium GW2011_GWF2_35_66]|uniref:Uncharacterized protein n=1 Tax=Candidatus Nomurabacteria bacterium GW2011_GWE1_35_16 TaxID=1618761 RepID=A0A0G0BAX2_9BACT|nr:MAG: hypothetical protein UR55_C0007G0016 [Candidatus Nomurabacteria bacterium GW2011_GWF1_34_20]KKP63291.1 MAG: hypothetical protein UR57_C0006G0016 [Candidatus Nomurabacteria bacterium GW2011_GWE2_34_25]KKP66489.1 MAG: hypothetical protein UR64_C0006G0016 [Candidatus Nomurabacteria bacterium GW2011_GWE1_35_16]KKP83713.1 MAG: hypothetical protein UR85_C0002G0026 [Candidatus Nomurabacteria bacterium GW2011_GWF2_35_66]
MNPETKICQNCKKDFTIEPDDFSFYEKIRVPAPTWCPECRSIRRMVHRNERNLYRRTCDVTGKKIISIYRDDCPYTICDKDYYFSNDFDPFKYGVTYNSNAKFFEQFYEFAKKVPLASLFVRNSENCEYNQDMGGASNCYLCSRTHNSKNMLYTYRGNHSSDCTDCFQAIENSEFLYESVNVSACSNSQFIHFCEKCSDSSFLYNCVGCVDCFMCTDMRNKQCYYKNEQYSRTDYKKIIDSYQLSTQEGQQKALKEFEDLLKKFPRRNLTITRSNNVTGDMIFDSKDSHDVFSVKGLQNCAYIWDSSRFSDSMDTYSGMSTELTYEATATTGHSSNCHFCVRVYDGSRDCEYSWFLQNCSNCFGCVGLKDTEYCIFNIKYSKEDYDNLLSKIKSKMREDKEYGEFFPLYISPFPYNDTVAHEYFPQNEQYAKERGMKWGNFEEKNYKVTMPANSLPNDIKDVPDSITGEVISCEHNGDCEHGCTKAFKIIPDELSFYRRRNLPLPKQCPNCRHYRRLAYRNSTQLRDVKCMCEGNNLSNGIYQNTVTHEHGDSSCGKNIKTTIDKDSDYVIYCEECYKKEVY